MIDLIAITEAGTLELEAALRAIQEELARRRDTAGPSLFTLVASPGNDRAGATAWVKVVTGCDPAKGNGYGILGDFVECGRTSKGRPDHRWQAAMPEGTLLVVGARGGSWKNQTSLYAVLEVSQGSVVELDSGYQQVQGSGLREVEAEVSDEEALKRWPELAPAVGKPLWHVFVALKERGL